MSLQTLPHEIKLDFVKIVQNLRLSTDGFVHSSCGVAEPHHCNIPGYIGWIGMLEPESRKI